MIKQIADYIEEVGAISSIISENMFEQVHMSVDTSKGVIGAHYKVSELAMEFIEEYKHIKDWDTFCEWQGISDWEECILNFVTYKLNKEAKNG